jgi:hypothetical protein
MYAPLLLLYLQLQCSDLFWQTLFPSIWFAGMARVSLTSHSNSKNRDTERLTNMPEVQQDSVTQPGSRALFIFLVLGNTANHLA